MGRRERLSTEPEIRIVGRHARLLQGGEVILEVPLPALARAIAGIADRGPGDLLPERLRFWLDRGDATAVAIEIAPHARTVRWLADGSRAPFGSGARYETYFLAFPFVILLLVFKKGELSGYQQLYYKTCSLDIDEHLLLPNLYNVARTPFQPCWVCLQIPQPLSGLPWRHKIDAVVNQVFAAAFNRSSEVHEGNSYWTSMREVDPRVRTLQAWQDATREDPSFPLGVPWKPAGTMLTRELMRMLDRVAPPRSLKTARDIAGLVTVTSARTRRQ